MAGIDRSKRIIVRTALITGSTIATVIGAQSLAILDQVQLGAASGADATVASADQTQTSTSSVVTNAAPNIVILRHPGETSSSTQTTTAQGSSGPVIRPPSPVEVTAPTITQQQSSPAVVTQQQTFWVPRTRSS